MNYHDFNLLLEKYLAGKCTREETEWINKWYEKQIQNDTPVANKGETEKRIWAKISKGIQEENYFFSNFSWIATTIAAIFIVVSALSYGYMVSNKKLEMKFAGKGIEMQNTSTKQQSFTLEDGTKIKLAANSKLSYPQHFGDKIREVYLEGEAFFDVSKNPSKPFIIHTGKLTTEVLGTSFNIKTLPNKKTIEVNVISGRVSVFENSVNAQLIRKGIILTPNQKIIFKEETSEIIPSIADAPIPIKEKIDLNFEDQKLQSVTHILSQLYGLEIVIENPALKTCLFTGDINDLSLLSQLELISKAVGAKIEQRGTSIFILGEGCK